RWGVLGTVGADGFTADIEIYLPEPDEKWLEGDRIVPSPRASVTIWDGQTIVYSTPIDDKTCRVVFVTAKLIQPAPIKRVTDRQPADLTPEQQDAIRKADDLASRASESREKGDHTAAEKLWTQCLQLLPEHPITKDRREAYTRQLERLWAEMNRSLKTPAPDPIDPGPGLFPAPGKDPAAPAHADFLLKSGEHLVIIEVKKGDTLLSIGRNHAVSVGRVKSVNRLPSDILRLGQLLLIPEAIDQKTPPAPQFRGDFSPDEPSANPNEIVLPSVELKGAPLADALSVLERASKEHDRRSDEPFADNCGFKISLEGGKDKSQVAITLKLQNVPFTEALRYV
ncbi:MAG: LysM peptidoglycan-binding domain-containing protein, partial [Verrucomicrobiae bacterium]|nr:LysM peptidoglycan-binding domain-containing protein [Verrucomicrobiae bacterium]